MKTRILYYPEPLPEVLEAAFSAPEMKRLQHVGMHCGCEYTSFPIFKNLASYSRYEHSYGVASIVYHFTQDLLASLAAAFHDIATPCFAHVIDFLHEDYEKQESTEQGTKEMILGSKEILSLLNQAGIDPQCVLNYHVYPIADNDSPKLSSDRLEYTLSNIINFGFAPKAVAQHLYDDLIVSMNEAGEPELAFAHLEAAKEFGMLCLKTSSVYICKEDRFSMFALASLLKRAISQGVITEADLYKDEPFLIGKLESDSTFAGYLRAYRGLSHVEAGEIGMRNYFIIPAKRRYIDPFIAGKKRLSDMDSEFKKELETFLSIDFTLPLGPLNILS